MHDDQLGDLKQFILAIVSQSEDRLVAMFTNRIDILENQLTKRMDEGFAGVGDAIVAIHEHNHKIEQRLAKLERAT